MPLNVWLFSQHIWRTQEQVWMCICVLFMFCTILPWQWRSKRKHTTMQNKKCPAIHVCPALQHSWLKFQGQQWLARSWLLPELSTVLSRVIDSTPSLTWCQSWWGRHRRIRDLKEHFMWYLYFTIKNTGQDKGKKKTTQCLLPFIHRCPYWTPKQSIFMS